MALEVEDGTGEDDSESYVSVAEADTYMTNHASPSTWTAATTAQKESALRFAARWLDSRYDWLSELLVMDEPAQALAWPRASFVDNDGRSVEGVPQRIKDAQCEAALAHLSTGLNEVRTRGGAVKRKKVDVLETEWFDGAPAGRTYPYIDSLVAPLLRYGSGTVRLVRA